MNIRLICMDLDGTLFSKHSEIPEINIRALRECAARGIRLALISGRNAPFVKRVAGRIGVPCAIVSANGAHIEETQEGNVLFEGTFSSGEWQTVFDAMMSANVNFEAYTKCVNYIVNPELVTERHRHSLELYVKMGDAVAEYSMDKLLREAPGATLKFVAFLKTPEDYERTKAILDARGIKNCSSAWENIEVMPTGVDKGAAVCVLRERFGVSKEETMAFGDFTNDLDMLAAAGYPVAMGNAVEEVKKAARIIAPPNTEGGVGQVIFERVLKGEAYGG